MNYFINDCEKIKAFISKLGIKIVSVECEDGSWTLFYCNDKNMARVPNEYLYKNPFTKSTKTSKTKIASQRWGGEVLVIETTEKKKEKE